MAEMLEDNGTDAITVGVYRTSSTVAGGRRFSFAALVVVGNRRGEVGVGYAKSNQVPQAVEKATREARRKVQRYPVQSTTVPHTVEGRFGATKVVLVPASPGTGIKAGAAVRAVLEMLGVKDCLSKCYGSSNPKNLVKATFDALAMLQTRERVEALRGVALGTTAVEDAIARGMAFMPKSSGGPRAQAPVNTVGDDRRRGGQRGGPRGGGRRSEGGDAPAAAPAAPTTEAPAADAPSAG
ncbi:MAG: 30S ribosomal protein S5 [Planctomycetes bacterium]|nr:30S ribosomal protein S5 [Planctomycetota bacterium]